MERIECQWCGLQNVTGTATCVTCGAPLDARDMVWYRTGTGNDRETHYPLGQFGDLFMAQQSPGLLLLHSPGNTFLRDLAPGEPILVQPSALLYRDVSVSMHLHIEYPQGAKQISWRSSFSQRTIWLRLVGPGRVAVASVFGHTSAQAITGNSPATVRRW